MSDPDQLSQQDEEPKSGISRREILQGLGAAAAMAYAGNAVSAMPAHDHSKHTSQLPGLLNAINDCTDKGERCIAHCLTSFVEGDLELAVCASKVQEMGILTWWRQIQSMSRPMPVFVSRSVRTARRNA